MAATPPLYWNISPAPESDETGGRGTQHLAIICFPELKRETCTMGNPQPIRLNELNDPQHLSSPGIGDGVGTI